MTTPLSELYLKACEFKGLARDIKVKGMSPAEGAAFRERERTKPLDAKVADCLTALANWIEWEREQIRKDGPYVGEAIQELIANGEDALAALRKELDHGK